MIRTSRVYKRTNVYEEALNRIRWVFDEFPVVVAAVSGGKDSTVIFNLTLQVARELGRLPLPVMFIDQEAEWEATIDVIREMMYHEDVEPHWYQIPMKMLNATSQKEYWAKVWDPEKEGQWMREKDPIATKENIYGQTQLKHLFGAIATVEYPDRPCAQLAGMRAEESPVRRMTMTGNRKYKWVTWGRHENTRLGHYAFYPIYDWTYSDVWKAIHDNGWTYNRIYDFLYAHGVSVREMRVSNLHHETAVHSLFFLQEMEPETYERLVRRHPGIDMAGKMGRADYWVKDLPFMFSSWREYRDYLLEHLLDDDPKYKDRFRKHFETLDRQYGDVLGEEMTRVQVQCLLVNDLEFVKLCNYLLSPKVMERRRGKGAVWEREAEEAARAKGA